MKRRIVVNGTLLGLIIILTAPWVANQLFNHEKEYEREYQRIQRKMETERGLGTPGRTHPTPSPTDEPTPSPDDRRETSLRKGKAWASWYDQSSLLHPSYRNLCPEHWGVAHRELPLGSIHRLCHSSECINVCVCDRGPEEWTGREWDLSKEAFERLAPLSLGVIEVIEK